MTCNFLTVVLPTRNLQDIKDKYADKPTTKCVSPYYIHVLPLLNRRGWKQLIFKNMYM
jgi:hypothetical protein